MFIFSVYLIKLHYHLCWFTVCLSFDVQISSIKTLLRKDCCCHCCRLSKTHRDLQDPRTDESWSVLEFSFTLSLNLWILYWGQGNVVRRERTNSLTILSNSTFWNRGLCLIIQFQAGTTEMYDIIWIKKQQVKSSFQKIHLRLFPQTNIECKIRTLLVWRKKSFSCLFVARDCN